MPCYVLLDHTADVGIKIAADHPRELFATAAYAMFDMITDLQRVEGQQRHKVSIEGTDWPDMMVNWLRELLFFWSGRQMLIKRVRIGALSAQRLAADLWYDGYDPQRHRIKEEIKAVTYHQIRVEQGVKGWEAQVIFDV